LPKFYFVQNILRRTKNCSQKSINRLDGLLTRKFSPACLAHPSVTTYIPKFLGIIFDRLFCFIRFLHINFYPGFKALRLICLCLLVSLEEADYPVLDLQRFCRGIRSILRLTRVMTFPIDTLKKGLEINHGSACRLIFGCLYSNLIRLLLLEALLSPLEITLNHHALSFVKRALRFPANTLSYNN